MPNGQLHILIRIDPINNLEFPGIYSLGQKLSAVGIKSRLIFRIEFIKREDNVFDKFVNGELLCFWTVAIGGTIESCSFGEWLELWIEDFLWTGGTCLVIGSYGTFGTLVVWWHEFEIPNTIYYAINKSINLL